MSKLSAAAQLTVHAIVNLAGNAALIAVLPSVLPHVVVGVLFLVFNVVQLYYAFTNPSYTVHLIETGQMAAPTAPAVNTPTTPAV